MHSPDDKLSNWIRAMESWELFPSARELPLLRRLFYSLCVFLGAISLMSVTLFSVVEITTTPQVHGGNRYLLLAAALGSAVHVVRETRATRPLSPVAWLMFVVAMSLLVWEVKATIKDPTAKDVFAAMAIGGSALLIMGRTVRMWGRVPSGPEEDADKGDATPGARE